MSKVAMLKIKLPQLPWSQLRFWNRADSGELQSVPQALLGTETKAFCEESFRQTGTLPQGQVSKLSPKVVDNVQVTYPPRG
jgi:hypothetical protein